MANLTVRNIPEALLEKLRLLSEIERRSLNSELLVVIEAGLNHLEKRPVSPSFHISAETQVSLWGEISGKWKDQRSKEEQIRETYEARTLGRDFSL
jgi:plasmid stability protein